MKRAWAKTRLLRPVRRVPVVAVSAWCGTPCFGTKRRYLQTINLLDAVNRPCAASIHSLPVYVLQGTRLGEIRPYRVDYAAAKAEPFTAAAKESLRQQLSAAPDTAAPCRPV